MAVIICNMFHTEYIVSFLLGLGTAYTVAYFRRKQSTSISQMENEILAMQTMTTIINAMTPVLKPNPSPVDPPVLGLAAHKKNPSATESTD